MPEFDVTITLEVSGAESEEEALELVRQVLETQPFSWRAEGEPVRVAQR